jgi:cell division protein FtsB
MAYNREQNNWQSIFWSKWFLLVILVCLFFVIFALVRSYFQDYQVKQEIERLKAEATALEAKKLETIEILKYIKSQDYAEEKARTEFNMAKPGENVYIISSQTDNEQAASNGQVDKNNIELISVKNPIKWWNLFTSKK